MSDIQLVLDGVPEEPAADPVQEQENALAAQKVLSEVENQEHGRNQQPAR